MVRKLGEANRGTKARKTSRRAPGARPPPPRGNFEFSEIPEILESLKCHFLHFWGEFYRILKIIKRHIKYTKDNTFQDFEYVNNNNNNNNNNDDNDNDNDNNNNNNKYIFIQGNSSVKKTAINVVY